MKLRDLLKLIARTAVNNDIVVPQIVGGTPRDKVLGILTEITDLDLTNGHHTISKLAQLVSEELKKEYSFKEKEMDDGHISLWLGSGKAALKIDFSSNFLLPKIDAILHNNGITDITSMLREQYSRDFTCNTLLMTLDLKTIKDPTHKGMEDIHKKLIRTCLDPDITLRYNTNRIIRVIYLASKLDFNVEPKIIEWIKEHKEFIKNISQQYMVKMLEKSIDKDADRTVWLINQMDIWGDIPITEKLYPYFARREKSAQLRRNFDLGEGLYQQMDDGKVKSVEQFRKKNRKKRKRIIKQIKDMKLK